MAVEWKSAFEERLEEQIGLREMLNMPAGSPLTDVGEELAKFQSPAHSSRIVWPGWQDAWSFVLSLIGWDDVFYSTMSELRAGGS